MTIALDADARLPTGSALLRLISPFQQMQQEDAQAAHKLAFLRPPHAVDFLGDMVNVGLSQFSRAQEFGLLSAPGVEIPIVEWALCRHGRRLRRLALPVYWRAFTVNTMRWPPSSRAHACSTSDSGMGLGRDLEAAWRGRLQKPANGVDEAVRRHTAETAAHERDRRRAQEGARQRDCLTADRADLNEPDGLLEGRWRKQSLYV